MIRLFLFLLFIIISNNVLASIQGETLICDKDRRGYNFISKDKVIEISINLHKLNIISTYYTYELSENAILIKKLSSEFNKKKCNLLGGYSEDL